MCIEEYSNNSEFVAIDVLMDDVHLKIVVLSIEGVLWWCMEVKLEWCVDMWVIIFICDNETTFILEVKANSYLKVTGLCLIDWVDTIKP